jgi:hypothetical protein
MNERAGSKGSGSRRDPQTSSARQGVGPSSGGGAASGHARGRAPSSDRRLPGALGERVTGTHLQHLEPGPAAEAGDRVGGGPLLLALRPGAFSCERVLPQGDFGSRLPAHPRGHQDHRRTHSAQGHPHLLPQAARLRPGDRSYRLGQIDDSGSDHRRDQRHAVRSHRNHRGPDRVPAHPQALRGQPTRSGERYQGLPPGSPLGAAAGPGRHPHRGDA